MEYWAHHVVLLLSSVYMSCVVDAQQGGAIITNPASLGITFKDNLKVTVTVLLLAFFSAFLIMGLISLYLRHCSYAYGGGRAPIAAASTAADISSRKLIIDKCPVLAVKDLRIGKAAAVECAVCLAEFRDHDSIRLLLGCHHVFHPDCIDSWLLAHMSCPVCRASLTADDIVSPISDTTTAPEPVNDSGDRNVTVTVTELEGVVTVPVEEEGEAADGSITVTSRESRMLVRSHSTGHSFVGPNDCNNNVARWWSLSPPLGFRRGGNDGNFLASEYWTCWTPLRMPLHRVQGQGLSSETVV